MSNPTVKTMKAFFFLLPLLCLAIALPQAFGQQPKVIFKNVIAGAANLETEDEDGDLPSFIVLQAGQAINLSGWYLTDSATNPTKWRIPDGYSLGAGEEMKIFASTKDRRPPARSDQLLHTNFQFPCSVPYVGLFNNGEQVAAASDQTDYCQCDGALLVGPNTTVRYIVPNDNVQGDWTMGSYPPAADWSSSPLCIGYDAAPNSLCEGLVLYEPLDGDTLDQGVSLDVSGSTNIHNGEPRGTGWQVAAAQIDKGMSISCSVGDGRGFIGHDFHPDLDPGKDADFAVSVWAIGDKEFPPNNGIQVIASNGAYEPGRPGWMIYRKDDQGTKSTGVRLISAQGNRYDLVLPSLEDGLWHHIAFTVCAKGDTDEIEAYFDGVAPQGPIALPNGEDFNTSGNGDRLIIGSDPTPAGRQFCGTLDDVAIWKKKLTLSEIGDLYEAGAQGVSFKEASGVGGQGKYDPYITRDVEAEMKGLRPGLYMRASFALSQFPGAGSKLTLRMRYDDGFAAYINGSLVLKRNAPSTLNENARALKNRADCLALSPETFDLDPSVLRQGNNILAIHALNATVNEDRFLICPELCLEAGQQEPDPDNADCVKTHLGKEFWLAFPENYEEEPGAPINLSLCIVGKRFETGIVTIPGMSVPGFPKAYTLDGFGKAVVAIPPLVELAGNDKREGKGIRIVAQNFVSVYAQNHQDYSTDGYLGLPLDCLGTEYVVMTYKNVQSSLPILQGSQFAVVAPYNNTTVTITPKTTIGTYTAGVPFDVLLQRGETYQLRNEADAPGDVAGTCIVSDKPVGVFGSHRCANIQSPTQWFCDTLVEQLLPEPAWGTNYRIAPLMTRGGDLVRITALKDGTFVSIFNPEKTNVILDRGEIHEFTMTTPASIGAEEKISVAQFSQSSDYDGVVDADPFMTLIQPRKSWLKGYLVCTPPATEFPQSYATVIADNTSDLSVITLNGANILGLPGAMTGTIPNSGGNFVRIPLPSSASNLYNFVTGRGPFALTIYGFDEFDSYGYPGGFCFQDTQPPTLICPQQVTVTCGSTPCEVDVPNIIAMSSIFDNIDDATNLTITQSPPAGSVVTGPEVYEILIEAYDSSQNRGTCKVELIVEKQNSPPQGLALPIRIPAVNGPEGEIDITAGFSDAEQASSTLDYEIVTVLGDVQAFEMIAVDNGTKELVVRCKPNLVATIDVRLRATDNGGLTGMTSQVIDIQGTPYQQWLNSKFQREILVDFGEQVIRWGEQADSDEDGNSTLGESYHGRDPNANDDIPLDTVEFDDVTSEWVFSWRRSLDNNGTEADGNWSPNLTDWYENNNGPSGDVRPINVTNGPVIDGERSCEARIPGATDERIFFRLTYRVVTP